LFLISGCVNIDASAPAEAAVIKVRADLNQIEDIKAALTAEIGRGTLCRSGPVGIG
jgi:hypothetical protein